MAKRIAKDVGNINDFPDDVLCHIISFLPTKDAVCTSILSKRWRLLFALLSNIDFEVKANDVGEWKQFLRLVDELMSSLHMPSMVRFRVRCGGRVFRKKRCDVTIKCVADWICALIPSNIQELDIGFDCFIHDCVSLPPDLFSFESLVVLKLNMKCTVKKMQEIPDRICLPNIKIIHFEGIHLSNDGSVGKLLSSCPLLEDLVLDTCLFMGGSGRFSVSNQNLRTLTLKYIITEGSNIRILINAPNLVFLNHYVSRSCSLEFVDVESLSEAIITAYPYVPTGFFTSTPDAISWMQNIEVLRIRLFLARELQHSNVSIPLFEKMKYLQIWFQESSSDPIEFDPIGLIQFLAHSVVLETLVLEESRMSCLPSTNKLKQYSLQECQLAPLLHHLKTVEIRLLDIGRVIVLMKVLKFILKSAKVLEVLKINSKEGCPEEQFKITERIMNFPRASEKCRALLSFDTSK